MKVALFDFVTIDALAVVVQGIENGLGNQVGVVFGHIIGMGHIEVVDLDGVVGEGIFVVEQGVLGGAAHAEAFQAGGLGDAVADAAGQAECGGLFLRQREGVARGIEDLAVVLAVGTAHVGAYALGVGVVGVNGGIVFAGGHQSMQRAGAFVVKAFGVGAAPLFHETAGGRAEAVREHHQYVIVAGEAELLWQITAGSVVFLSVAAFERLFVEGAVHVVDVVGRTDQRVAVQLGVVLAHEVFVTEGTCIAVATAVVAAGLHFLQHCQGVAFLQLAHTLPFVVVDHSDVLLKGAVIDDTVEFFHHLPAPCRFAEGDGRVASGDGVATVGAAEAAAVFAFILVVGGQHGAVHQDELGRFVNG